MRSDITPGQTSDYQGFDLVMGDNLPEPSVLLADRGYDSDKVRKTMEARNVVPVIPMRKSRKLRVAVDRTLYRLRNLVERCFNKLKNAVRHRPRTDGGSMPHRRYPLRQDSRELPGLHRHNVDPPLASPFVNMT
jgi:transposase